MVPLTALVGANPETEGVWTDKARPSLHGRGGSRSSGDNENPVGTAWGSHNPTAQGRRSGRKRRDESSAGRSCAGVAALGRPEGEGRCEFRQNRGAASQDHASSSHRPVLY